VHVRRHGLAVEHLGAPGGIVVAAALQTHRPDANGDDVEPLELPITCADTSEVHEREIVSEPELLVAADAFVVIDQVAAAVEDELAAIDLDCLRVVGRMTVDEIDPRFSDEIVCQGAARGGCRGPSCRPNVSRQGQYRRAA